MPIPRSAAIMTVELMLFLRVLALCELNDYISIIFSKVTINSLLYRWKLVGKEGIYDLPNTLPRLGDFVANLGGYIQALARFLVIQFVGKLVDQGWMWSGIANPIRIQSR